MYNEYGSKRCNAVRKGRACKWICDCNNINIAKPEVCTLSTCLGQPELDCRYSEKTGCDCPISIANCCKDHPKKNNNFDCASMHMFGTLKCNAAEDGRTCLWSCGCNDIDDEEICAASTCANDPEKRCSIKEKSCLCN